MLSIYSLVDTRKGNIPSGAISVCLVGPVSTVEYSLLPILITKKNPVLITAQS